MEFTNILSFFPCRTGMRITDVISKELCNLSWAWGFPGRDFLFAGKRNAEKAHDAPTKGSVCDWGYNHLWLLFWCSEWMVQLHTLAVSSQWEWVLLNKEFTPSIMNVLSAPLNSLSHIQRKCTIAGSHVAVPASHNFPRSQNKELSVNLQTH